MRARRCALALGLVTALMVVAVHAADKDKEALKRVQQTASRLQVEKSALEREKQELTAKMDAAIKDLEGVKSEAARSKHRAAKLDTEAESLRRENAELKAQLESTGKNLADTSRQCEEAAALAQHNQKRMNLVNTNLKTMLAKEESDRNTCQANNLKLRTIAHELLDRYQNKGVFQGLLQAEPFTQLKSVEIENLVQDTRDKIDDLKAESPK